MRSAASPDSFGALGRAGQDFRFAMNRIQTLLIEKDAKLPDQRRSHFVAALCLAWPDGHLEKFEGRVRRCRGLAAARRCRFRLRSLFLPDGHERTFGQMSALEKHGPATARVRAVAPRPVAFVMLADACLR